MASGMEIVGIVEKVKIIGAKSTEENYALFDTGANSTSVDINLAARVQLGPIIRTTRIRSASLKERVKRPVVGAVIEISGKRFETEVNLQDRSHMAFPVIIGRNVISGNFLVDCHRNMDIFSRLKGKKEEERETE